MAFPPVPTVTWNVRFLTPSRPWFDPQDDRSFKTTRTLQKKKNALDFFHVCPLLMHEKMGDGAGRPVYKFVFACPGRARALVSARREH